MGKSCRLLLALVLLLLAAPALAAPCGGDFNAFLAAIARDAQAPGRLARGHRPGLRRPDARPRRPRLRPPPARHVPRQELRGIRRHPGHPGPHQPRQETDAGARRAARAHRAAIRRARAVIVAVWTLESDNGTGDMGKLPVIRTVATLAHDCRRTELFQRELIAALQIVQRGDLPLRDLIGAYAGEIGQTQFLPSSYIKYGVDYDGNGHVDLRHSVPDVLASTANLLKTNGWRAGAPFTAGTPNFEVAMRERNHSEVYRKTIVLMAQRLGGG